MKKYLVDTNILLRFVLKDHPVFFKKAKRYFQKAKGDKIELILLPEVIFEIDYVLRGVYSLSKNESAELLSQLVKSPLLKIDNRKTLIEAIEKYRKINVDLFDIFLHQVAKENKVQVLSFDKDFKKII